MNGYKGLLRYSSYVLFVGGLLYGMLVLGRNLPGGLYLSIVPDANSQLTTSEYSLVEMLQNILITFCCLVFAWIATRDRLRRPLAVGIASLFALFLVRELDFFLDRNVADNFWQVLAVLITATSSVYVYRHRKRLETGWYRSWPSAGMALMIAGLIILIPFAQLAANDGMWRIILGEDYVRAAKLATEELMELGGYFLLVIGTLEFLYAWSRLPETRTIEPVYKRGRRRRKRTAKAGSDSARPDKPRSGRTLFRFR